jgi:hypothetical protein
MRYKIGIVSKNFWSSTYAQKKRTFAWLVSSDDDSDPTLLQRRLDLLQPVSGRNAVRISKSNDAPFRLGDAAVSRRIGALSWFPQELYPRIFSDDRRRGIRRIVVDHDDFVKRRRISLREQSLDTGLDVALHVEERDYHGDVYRPIFNSDRLRLAFAHEPIVIR